MPFDLPAYLNRIGLVSCEPTEDGLKALQRGQLSSIPFENVTAFLGGIPDVTLEAVWDKLVTRKLGGYCFEVNTLFGAALDAAGFKFQPVLARVRKGPPENWNRSHLAYVVELEGQEWLADTGFGGPAPAEPVRLDLKDSAPQIVRGQTYRVRIEDLSEEMILEKDVAGEWLPLYSFDRVRPTPADIAAANYLCATWDQKPFTANMIFYRLTESGRFSFLNGAAKRKDEEDGTTWQTATLDEFQTFITGDIGLCYDRETVVKLWEKMSGLHPPA